MNTLDFIKQAQEYQKGKVCTRCKEHKPLSEFFKNKNFKDGFQFHCKSCARVYYENVCPFKKWFKSKLTRTKSNGIEFTIEPEDIPGVKIRETLTIGTNARKYTSWEAVEYPKVCPVLGLKLDWGMNGRQPNSPSLDRIDSTKWYIPGNVMMMSDLANKMKQNATPEQLKQFSRYHLFGVKSDKK